jgi:hypothetical protein
MAGAGESWMIRCGLAFLLPTLTGCFAPIPFGYPTWSQTRPVFLDKDEDTVRAFRLDLKQDCSSPEFSEGNDCHWSEIGRWPFDVIPGQAKLGVSYGYHWNCIALIYHKQVFHRVLVRFYRPGYETVELSFWNGAKPIEWKPAVTTDAQERALDDLLAFTPGRYFSNNSGNDWSFGQIPPGSASPQHCEVLLFAASEFERLSRTPCDEQVRQRLASKAQWLREHADK